MPIGMLEWQVRLLQWRGPTGRGNSSDADHDPMWEVAAADYLPYARSCGCRHIAICAARMIRLYVIERLDWGDLRCRPITTRLLTLPLVPGRPGAPNPNGHRPVSHTTASPV
jgi:hypothetical protein